MIASIGAILGIGYLILATLYANLKLILKRWTSSAIGSAKLWRRRTTIWRSSLGRYVHIDQDQERHGLHRRAEGDYSWQLAERGFGGIAGGWGEGGKG